MGNKQIIKNEKIVRYLNSLKYFLENNFFKIKLIIIIKIKKFVNFKNGANIFEK